MEILLPLLKNTFMMSHWIQSYSFFKVDSIEQNVESTDVRVHEGTEQLRQAETYRNRARKKKFILCLIGVILLIILIIIIATNVN